MGLPPTNNITPNHSPVRRNIGEQTTICVSIPLLLALRFILIPSQNQKKNRNPTLAVSLILAIVVPLAVVVVCCGQRRTLRTATPGLGPRGLVNVNSHRADQRPLGPADYHSGTIVPNYNAPVYMHCALGSGIRGIVVLAMLAPGPIAIKILVVGE